VLESRREGRYKLSMLAVVVEAHVQPERVAEFLHATRIYRQLTRTELGSVRVDLVRAWDSPSAFLLYELYRSREAYEAHLAIEHTRFWESAVTGLVSAPLSIRHFQSDSVDPAPPQFPARRPRVESSAFRNSAAREQLGRAGQPPPLPPSTAADRGAPRLRLPRIRAELERLELASAHDGFLRGSPELCFVLAVYARQAGELVTLGRALYRLALRVNAPCVIECSELLFDVPIEILGLPAEVGVLMLAVEENGGKDVQGLYQELADPLAFRLWHCAEDVPEPADLSEWFEPGRPFAPARVQVLRESQAVAESLLDDTWVGASLGHFVLPARGHECVGRFHVASADGQNDWLAVIGLALH
jgi:autoinducer 2-degrading protein